MTDLQRTLIVSVLFLIATQAQLVQIVTPESTDFTTDVPEAQAVAEGVARKREANNGTLDSYLEALKQSQGSSNRYDPPQPEDVYYHEDSHPGEISYGPPKGYQSKPASYHSPSKPSPPVMYGPPSPVPSYLPPQPTGPPSTFYGMPFAAGINPQNAIMSLLSSIMPKGLDMEVVFKLLLKLTLFKMIVKFIAVLCLMMAWPLFQSKDKEMMEQQESDDDKRQFDTLNDLTETVWNSIFPRNGRNGTLADEDGDEEEDEGELVEKVAGQIDEKMTAPSEAAAIGFLEFCVAAANTAVGWMMSFMRRRNNEMDPIEEFLWSLWAKIKSRLTTIVVDDSHLRRS